MKNLRDEKEITIHKRYVSWDEVEEFIRKLSIETDSFKDFNGVYGPARGGLVFAVIISERYNLPFLAAPQQGCIIVDDICDSGNTALAWRDKGYTIATMFYKEESKVTPDYWQEEKFNDWIVFPWE